MTTQAHPGGYKRRHGRPTKFTPGVFRLIQAWTAWGFDRREIAHRIDTTVRSLEAQCSMHGVRLNPGGSVVPAEVLGNFRAGNVCYNDAPAASPPWRLTVGHPIVVRPSPEMMMGPVADAARARGLSPAQLLTRVIEAVVRDNLIDAVLDDAPAQGAVAVKPVDART